MRNCRKNSRESCLIRLRTSAIVEANPVHASDILTASATLPVRFCTDCRAPRELHHLDPSAVKPVVGVFGEHQKPYVFGGVVVDLFGDTHPSEKLSCIRLFEQTASHILQKLAYLHLSYIFDGRRECAAIIERNAGRHLSVGNFSLKSSSISTPPVTDRVSLGRILTLLASDTAASLTNLANLFQVFDDTVQVIAQPRAPALRFSSRGRNAMRSGGVIFRTMDSLNAGLCLFILIVPPECRITLL